MNERIRELAEQSGFFPELNWDHTAWHAAGHNDTFEKFAELIVKETLQVARAGIEFGDGMEDAVYKYFGVEE